MMNAEVSASASMDKKIGYYLSSNIQHLPPVIRLYPRLGGVIITDNTSIFARANEKYSDYCLDIRLVENRAEARKLAFKLRLRLIVYPSFHLLYCGVAVQVFHGGLSDKRYIESARLTCYDLVLFPGQKAVDKAKLAGTLPYINSWKLVGYPKFDEFYKGSLTPVSLFDEDRKVILYAPTWDSSVTSMKLGERSLYGESSIQLWSLEIVRQLGSHYNVIMKFHSKLVSDKIDIYDRVKDLIEELGYEANVKVVIDDDITPYMAASDAMISDISSVCYEWLHFDRPILFANPAPGRYKAGNQITDNTYVWQAGTVIDHSEDLLPFVRQALATDDKQQDRRKLLDYAVFDSRGESLSLQANLIEERYQSVRHLPWWWLYLRTSFKQRIARLFSTYLRYSKKIPR